MTSTLALPTIEPVTFILSPSASILIGLRPLILLVLNDLPAGMSTEPTTLPKEPV